jgi:hypothetical protein
MQAVEAELGARIELEGDFYWHLPIESAFKIATEPNDLSVGQLTDDVMALMQAQDPELSPDPAWHELAHLIGVLRALEWHLQPKNSGKGHTD